MTIHSISKQIAKLAKRLEKGKLHADEIIEMTDLSRQLHERMIVLQYKTFEEMPEEKSSEKENLDQDDSSVLASAEGESENNSSEKVADNTKQIDSEPSAKKQQVPEIKPPETYIADEQKAEALSEERAAFRMDNTIIPSNQISLIDSIEEIKEMEKSLNDAFGDKAPSLAQKLNKKPIANLKSAITINQKFKFISGLFQNDAEAFETAIDRINGCVTYLEADEYIQNGPSTRFEWEMKSTTVMEMMELVERRFL